MLGILIVDDDAVVRMNLKSIIEWEKEGFIITGEAENGKKGLELIRLDKPDIVITDVKMPIIDGLEMIRNARAELAGLRFIVLSSYDEFGLLKTAVTNGVTDYLLKLELTSEVLLSTPENIKKSILYEDNTARNLEISPYSKLAQILRRVLAGHYAEEELEHTLKMVNQDIKAERLSCIAVRFSLFGKGTSFGAEDWRTLEIAVHSVIHDITKQFYPGISFLEDTGVCLFVYTPAEGCGRVREMGGIIITMLKQYFNLDSSVGAASLTGGINDIHRIMIEAIQATEEVFFRGYGSVIYSAEISGDERDGGGRDLNSWAEPFQQALELGQPDRIKEAFEVISGLLSAPARVLIRKEEEKPRAGRISRNGAFNLCFSVINLSLSILKDSSGGRALFNENLYETVNAIETLEGLRDWMKSFKEKVLEIFISSGEKNYDNHIVTAAKRYIAENCDKPISLDMAAKSLSISSGYLSAVFKRRTQMGFVEYITKVKIGKAKKLLLSGQYTIFEVSYMVGYEDTGCFSKIFHKATGLTPKEFIARHT
ncbi:MAG: response regulator [Treponema sp.]|jgi:two-component system response regulator YesN|nr:response regulator [Treponema sp.]